MAVDPKPRRWPGPVSRRTPASALRASRCVACGQRLTPDARRAGDWWCWSCKDPEGTTLRLQQAQHEAAQRCAERYPAHEATQGELFA
jgi:phage/plasmid primase-like uncharacterized protein